MEPLPQTCNAVGLDVGLKSFVVDSDGNSVENPRFAEKAVVKIKNIQRRLSRAEKGSNNCLSGCTNCVHDWDYNLQKWNYNLCYKYML